MNRSFVLLLVLLGICSAAPTIAFDAEAWKVRQSRMVLRAAEVSVGGEIVKIEIYTEPERQGWGREIAEWVTRLLPAYYSRFGKPRGIDIIRIIEEPELPSAGWNALKEGIRLRHPAGPDVLAEQLAHLWFYPGTISPPWLMKGVARWQGLLALRDARFGLQAMDGWRQTLVTGVEGAAAFDKPLTELDFYKQTQDQFTFSVAKATIFVAIMQSTLGKRGFDGWLDQVTATTKAKTLDDLKAAIQASGNDPAMLLAGWVDKGAYQRFSWPGMQDGDRDGLPDALEPLLGTKPQAADSDNDQLADGFEYWHGLSPVDRDSDGDGKPDAPPQVIAVDGLGYEWAALDSAKRYSDAKGDGQEFDIGDLHFLQTAASLYVQIQPVKTINPAAQFWLTLQFDVDDDQVPEIIVIADHAERAWFGRAEGGKLPNSGNPASGLIARLGETFEIAVPLALFEGAKSLAINVRVDRPGAVAAIDHTGGYWHQLKP